jgi:hypothetical protein
MNGGGGFRLEKTENRIQKAEYRRQNTEDRIQKTVDSRSVSRSIVRPSSEWELEFRI